uniref:DNA topoisomerase (ATP-hydrolyzing) n=1 Tax=viral metagenome TaxID=1070528 RepID=A0A6C0AWW6_9ZZZZ|tara:strand:- start:68230 stop:71730 length:3501 start_codon:yes stop_codon:yes gene_type:complete
MSVKKCQTDLNKYQKKSDREHILDNPDTYIGSVELIDSNEFILSEDKNSIIKKTIQINPGLYKLFDEGIVNCRDHVIRMQQQIKEGKENIQSVSYIDVGISDDGTITMINDGNGIDVAEHPEYKIWIPEMIFGHLRTSTNYNKEEKKIIGGKNGFGFKLVLIWSTWGRIETVDHTRGLKYVQEFKDNLLTIEKPTITKCKNKPYTKIEFKPDYKRLQLKEGITPDIYNLLMRRIYDIGAVTDQSVKVKLNSNQIPIKNFQQYVKKIVGSNDLKYECSNDRWEYAIALAPDGEFTQISFCNGIYTSKGGKHVEYIMNQIVKKLTQYIKEKKKVDVKPSAIKEQLFLFLRCDIENPNYDSQSKEFLNTPSSKFGSNCNISDKFIEGIAKMGVMSAACQITEIKENKSQKKTDGTKSRSIRGIPKLIDANFAGTTKSGECSLILCEGDSAKAGIVSGLSKDDRNTIGIYPMKGKMFNVRGESVTKIGDNKEICEIKQILGLEYGKNYTANDVKNKLRYGKILFMTDQDLDGSHIKGLGLNLFEAEWRSLIEIPEFIGYMNTPILKAEKAGLHKEFYNEGEFELWKNDIGDGLKSWKIKYYKGLGTSTSKEFKEYFAQKKIVFFESTGDKSIQTIDMVFNKKRSDDRKDWLATYNRELYLDTSKSKVTYEEFIHNDLIHFSKYDNDRSIPNLIDGLKISLRKILFAAFKKKLNSEIKVAQFSGYVSEHSGYHHGEASLNGAIIGLAQNYVGSNNINIFEPLGQFGTRLTGGKDAASERYIFTKLNKLTRIIFPVADDDILQYLDDDGTSVEPIYYVPIIPMVLVNGAKGIGTGFSTDIMCYNPLQIINKLILMLKGEAHNVDIDPYYKGFKGTIESIEDKQNKRNKKYLIRGVFEKIKENKIRITELPIGTWTQDYKEFIESLIDHKKKDSKPLVKDYVDMSTDANVDFTIEFHSGCLGELLTNLMDISGGKLDSPSDKVTGVEKLLKLYTTHTTTNMHLFDANEHLRKFDTASEIIEEYYQTRLTFYEKRKKYQIDKIEKELIILSNKARFINDNLSGKIDLRRKKKDEIVVILTNLNYTPLCDEGLLSSPQFNYLTKMPMDSVTEEAVEKLMKEKQEKDTELNVLKSMKIEKIWLNELEELKKEYIKFMDLTNNKPSDKSIMIRKKKK